MSRALSFAPPRKLTDELVAEMLLAISEGQTVSGLWARDPAKYPHPVTWSDRVAADPALSLACARAKQHAAEFHIETAQAVISTEPERVYTKEGSRYDSAHVTWLKNRTDFHLKRAAQIKPDEYGDKQLHAGHDGGVLKTELAVSLPELAERLRDARRAAGAGPGPVIEHQPRGPEPSTTALLDADVARPVPTHDPAPLLHGVVEQHGVDDGLDFV